MLSVVHKMKRFSELTFLSLGCFSAGETPSSRVGVADVSRSSVGVADSASSSVGVVGVTEVASSTVGVWDCFMTTQVSYWECEET